eukprot:gene32036-39572_t
MLQDQLVAMTHTVGEETKPDLVSYHLISKAKLVDEVKFQDFLPSVTKTESAALRCLRT